MFSSPHKQAMNQLDQHQALIQHSCCSHGNVFYRLAKIDTSVEGRWCLHQMKWLGDPRSLSKDRAFFTVERIHHAQRHVPNLNRSQPFWCFINLFGCVRTCVLAFDYLLILYVPALVIVVSNVSRLVVYSCFCELRSNLLVLRRLLFSGCSCLLWAASLCIGAKKTLWDLLQERLRNSVKLNISRRR